MVSSKENVEQTPHVNGFLSAYNLELFKSKINKYLVGP